MASLAQDLMAILNRCVTLFIRAWNLPILRPQSFADLAMTLLPPKDSGLKKHLLNGKTASTPRRA